MGPIRPGRPGGGPTPDKHAVAEVDFAIRDAYAATYDERVLDGISGHYLPMASRLTPVRASLVCDDLLLIDAAEALLEGPVITECPEGVLYFAEAGSHNDDGIGVTGVKFASYFDPLTAANGALCLVPGSHRPGQTARLARTIVYQRCPDTDAARDRTRRSMHDSFEQACRGFDCQRYPIWRDWLADADTHPRRVTVVERLRAAGVADLPGVATGW